MRYPYDKKNYLVVALLLLITTSCHTTRKTSGEGASSTSGDIRWTSGELSKAIRDSYIRYHTLSARVHIDFENEKQQYNNVTAYLRMKKDSIIWLSVRPVLGIEMARLVLTPDSVKLRNNLKRTVFIHSARDMEQVLHIPFDFSVLESLLLGNPVGIPEKVRNFKTDSSGVSVTLSMDSIICRYHWTADPFVLKKSHFQLSGSTAAADQLFSGYQDYAVGEFALRREIKMQSRHATRIRLTFDKINFDIPVDFPFRYDESYQKK